MVHNLFVVILYFMLKHPYEKLNSIIHLVHFPSKLPLNQYSIIYATLMNTIELFPKLLGKTKDSFIGSLGNSDEKIVKQFVGNKMNDKTFFNASHRIKNLLDFHYGLVHRLLPYCIITIYLSQIIIN